jgi:hypothetical protein
LKTYADQLDLINDDSKTTRIPVNAIVELVTGIEAIKQGQSVPEVSNYA